MLSHLPLQSRPVKGLLACFFVSQCRALRLSHGALVGILLALGGLTLGVAVYAQTKSDAPISGRETASLGTNLVPSGDFAPGATGWKAELANGKASAALSWPDDAILPQGAAGKVARFDVEAIDKDRWHVQFYHDGLDLNDNDVYTLTFWAKAGQERLLSVSVNADEDDYHPVGLDHQVTIGTQWRKISLAFTALRVRKNHTRLCFMLGDALGRVELADARLQKGVLAPPPVPTCCATLTSRRESLPGYRFIRKEPRRRHYKLLIIPPPMSGARWRISVSPKPVRYGTFISVRVACRWKRAECIR